ncbi:MAG: hypothetical protein FD137_838 [Spirochaetes bacterium]|nr:MAG: hypothetical protein FD137_838 [Spirochaetota bacterium]
MKPISIPIPMPSYGYLLDMYREYANPKDKIARECEKGRLVRLKRGLYVTREALDKGFPPGLIGNCLYGPSYISFAYALQLYSIIPELAPHPTSATFAKRRQKRFDTPLGSFFYRDVAQAAYSEDVIYLSSGPWRFLAATAEKALCDELSINSEVRSKKSLEILLFENLRIDTTEFERLDLKRLASLAPLYRSGTLDVFLRYIEGSR